MCNVLERSCYDCSNHRIEHEHGECGTILSSWLECKYAKDTEELGIPLEKSFWMEEHEKPLELILFDKIINAELLEDFIEIASKCTLFVRKSYSKKDMFRRLEHYEYLKRRGFTEIFIKEVYNDFSCDMTKKQSRFYDLMFKRERQAERHFSSFF